MWVTSNELRELNIHAKEDGAARQKEVRKLERELESICDDTSMKELWSLKHQLNNIQVTLCLLLMSFSIRGHVENDFL